jgi:hypothetical protein
MQKQKLIELCKAAGVMLLDDGDVIRMDAPRGYVLKGNFTHSADVYLRGWSRAAAYQYLSEELGEGVEKCDDESCESCQSEDSEFEALQRLYGGERLA